MVSVVGVVVTQVMIVVTHAVLGWPGALSNFTSVTVAAVPAYLLNRYWVWKKTDRNRLTTEVLPFWGMTIAGLLLSTVFVAWIENLTTATWAVSAANLSAFGLLWVGKFFILDRLLFRRGEMVAVEAGASGPRSASE
jgi:putative flippase GtrA